MLRMDLLPLHPPAPSSLLKREHSPVPLDGASRFCHFWWPQHLMLKHSARGILGLQHHGSMGFLELGRAKLAVAASGGWLVPQKG